MTLQDLHYFITFGGSIEGEQVVIGSLKWRDGVQEYFLATFTDSKKDPWQEVREGDVLYEGMVSAVKEVVERMQPEIQPKTV